MSSSGVARLSGSRRWSIRILLVVVAVAAAVLTDVGTSVAIEIPRTLSDSRPLNEAAVESTFALDYVGVIWETSAEHDEPPNSHDLMRSATSFP